MNECEIGKCPYYKNNKCTDDDPQYKTMCRFLYINHNK